MYRPGLVPSLTALFLVVLSLGGCATVNPDRAFVSTQDLLEGRHPGEAAWLRDDEARSAAQQRLAALLATPLTMDAAAEVALLRNPTLQATLENLGIAQADLAQATRLANPGISFSRLTGSGQTLRTLSVTGDIVDWLTQPLRRRMATAELERTKLEVGHALLDTVAEARLALVRYQTAERLAERLGHIEQIDGAAAEYAQALFDAGNVTALERANAHAAWGETRGALGRARLDAARAREDVHRALGLSGDETWSAAEAVPDPGADANDSSAWQQVATDSRLDLAAARWAVSALEHALSLKRGTRFSPLGVEVGVERERETDGLKLTGPTIELRLPIFDTGKASIARLRSEVAQARWQVQALENLIRSEVREKAADLEASRELYLLYRDTVLPLRGEVLDRTLREYNQMLVGTFDVLLAKQQVISAEQRAIEALDLFWQARIELDRATGGQLPIGAAVPAPPESMQKPGTKDHDPHQHHNHGASGPAGQESRP